MMTHKQIKLLGLTGAISALAALAQAQPYYIAGDVVNNWQNDATFDSTNSAYQLTGGPTVYSYTVTNGTAGNYEQLKIIPTAGSWNTVYPANNLWVKLDAGGSNTIYFYPGTSVDGWSPAQNRVGYADPGNMAWEITGDFTTPQWGSDPNAQMTSAGNGLYTNTYVIATPGVHEFKFRTPNTWSEVNFGADFGNGSGNASVTTTVSNQPVLIQLDLPDGRWAAGNIVAPVTNQVVFAVDMTAQLAAGHFIPGTDSVFVSGAFNGWPGTGPAALVLTNYPPYNGGSNTNIYYATNTFIAAPGSFGSDYKFTCNDTAFSSGGGYEPINNNRSFSLMTNSGTLELPVVLFGNVLVSDYLTTGTTIYFTVNMTNATTTDGHAFDPNTDQVVINGNFVPGGWAAWDPISLASQVMANDPVGSEIYTYSATIPAGALIGVDYKYGVIYSGQTNNVDNEAGFAQDHFRYIRSTATGSYTNSMDTFGNQYVEPSFGQLTSTSTGAGQVTVSWLGRPGVELQTSANLAGGIWQTNMETDGTNWTAGYNTVNNGFMSQTNLPAAGGQQFFRLIQSW